MNDSLNNMKVNMLDVVKLVGTKEYQSYMIQNCHDQVVAAQVAEAKRMVQKMKQFSDSYNELHPS
jgi:hypothetical protein